MEYIVYCTTNLINKKIYVGVHKTASHLEFDGYIGCGVYINLPSSYNYAKTAFLFAVKKYGPKNFRRIIIQVFDNEEDAYNLEAEIVNLNFLSRKDVYNEVLGGGGSNINSKPCYQYDLNGNFIKEYYSQQDASREVNRGFTTIKRAIKERIKAGDYFWTDIKYEKLDLTLFKTTDNRIPVFQYSSTGEYDCCYESIADAARVNNSTSSNIVRGIKLGYLVANKYFSYEFFTQFSAAKTEHIKNRKLYQYSLNGEFIREFESNAEVCRCLGKSLRIAQAIKLGRTAGGYQWNFEKVPYMEKVQEHTAGKARKVAQYTKEGQLIKIFNTVTECKKEFPSCLDNLHGRTKSSRGYVFKYYDE